MGGLSFLRVRMLDIFLPRQSVRECPLCFSLTASDHFGNHLDAVHPSIHSISTRPQKPYGV